MSDWGSCLIRCGLIMHWESGRKLGIRAEIDRWTVLVPEDGVFLCFQGLDVLPLASSILRSPRLPLQSFPRKLPCRSSDGFRLCKDAQAVISASGIHPSPGMPSYRSWRKGQSIESHCEKLLNLTLPLHLAYPWPDMLMLPIRFSKVGRPRALVKAFAKFSLPLIQRRVWLNVTIFVCNVETYSNVQNNQKDPGEHENHNRVDTNESYHSDEIGDPLVCLFFVQL